jgi:transposase-like protein
MFKKKVPEQTFVDSVAAAKSMRMVIEGNACPACKQTTLALGKYVVGPTGWEAEVSCTNCFFSGVVNSTGFQFVKIDSRGRAREKR